MRGVSMLFTIASGHSDLYDVPCGDAALLRLNQAISTMRPAPPRTAPLAPKTVNSSRSPACRDGYGTRCLLEKETTNRGRWCCHGSPPVIRLERGALRAGRLPAQDIGQGKHTQDRPDNSQNCGPGAQAITPHTSVGWLRKCGSSYRRLGRMRCEHG